MDLTHPCSGKDMKILALLSKIAEAVPPIRSARIAAALVIKNDIISFGINQMKTHPFQARYSRNDQAIYVHAENAAIMRALKKVDVEDLKKATLYVARVKKPNNMWGMACPCEGCQKAIDKFGIKKVVYTEDTQGYSVL